MVPAFFSCVHHTRQDGVCLAQRIIIVSKKGGAVTHITTLGIDLAKNLFQVHGVDDRGRVVLSRRVRRSQLLEVVASLHSV